LDGHYDGRMRFVPAAIVAVLFLFISGVQLRAQSADERYVQIFNWIQEADASSEHGELRQAVTRYLEAEKALKNLHSAFPGWHETVVKFRLAYLGERIDALTQKLPQTNQVAAAQTNTNATASASTNAILQLNEEIKRLNAQNALLEAKLKEAFSVQPAAVDPRELAKAEDKIRELQKERDLLKANLEKQVPAPDMTAIEQERKLLADIKARLSQEMEKSATLAIENTQLKEQVTSLVSGGRGGSKELQVARAMIAALQATNTVLRSELLVLQSHMAETPKMLANAEPNEDLQKQLEAARARLQMYEAAPIPYTAEELAFFKQPALRVAVSDFANNSNSAADSSEQQPRRKQHEIPPGAGALLAEAQRAAETGRYEEAEQKYLQVLRQDENNVYTLANLAAVQIDLNRPDDAEKNLKKALAADPRDSASLFLYGRLKYMQKKWDEALDHLSRAAAIMPDEPRTQFYLGKTLIEKGNRNQAEKVLRKAVQLKPGWGEAHYLLAVLYGTQQPPFKELAEWHYKKAISGGYPRNPEFEKTIEEKAPNSAAR
jgi:tetratricopeptide (TPR) repeat protein